MHPKNTTGTNQAQAILTTEVDYLNTPIDNQGLQLLRVAAGANAEDALETAKVLSSGLGQLCQAMHDSLNMGEMAYCDGMATLCFLAETVSALVWSTQKGIAAASLPGGDQ
ncbi:hypothetical protein D3C77_340090 [compost metagenome]